MLAPLTPFWSRGPGRVFVPVALCNRAGWIARSLSAPSLAAPPPSTRRDVSPTKPMSSAIDARGKEGGMPVDFKKLALRTLLSARARA